VRGDILITVRQALIGDAEGIARVHVSSWQTSYRGIVPDEMLDNLSVARREAYWQGALAGEDVVFVAEAGGEIVGFASGGAARELEGYDGELYAIYLLEAFKRQGLGARLFAAVREALAARGYASLMLWVLRDNAAGRAFYERLGGVPAGEKAEMMGAFEAVEVAYGWGALMSSR
jgi:ribosomal protein S18 acetylase RimI-like enzyme